MVARYLLHDMNLADWKSVCIIDIELDIVILHFNITNKFDFDQAIKLGQQMVENLNNP